jgi:hypothetical protein
LVTAGFDAALERKKRATSATPHKLDGVGEAKLIAMRLGKPPAGYGRWSLRLLADELAVLEVVPSICAETVRKTLKKSTTAMKLIFRRWRRQFPAIICGWLTRGVGARFLGRSHLPPKASPAGACSGI